MKNIPSFDAFINESEEINEASNNLVYISDKKFKSVEDITNSFEANAGKAWEKFISDKMGVKVKGVAKISSRRGNFASITTDPITTNQLGIFKFCLDWATVDNFGGGEIHTQMVNNSVFEFSPFIYFRIHLSYSSKSGGTNGLDVVLSGNTPRDSSVWYDVLNNTFLDQAEATRIGDKIWLKY
jgi:hypothetical protein